MTQNVEDEKISVSKLNSSLISMGFAQNFALPLLPLPNDLKYLGVNNTRIGKILIPKADPIVSEYEKKYAQIIYTQKFVKFVQDNPTAAGLIKNVEMRKVLAKYLPNTFQTPFDFSRPQLTYDFSYGFLFPASGLNSQLTALRDEYVKKLSAVQYSNLNKLYPLEKANAEQLIKIAEGFADAEINKFFGGLFLASFNNVESIIQKAETGYDLQKTETTTTRGVNPVTRTPGINAVGSGILGELRPGVGGDGRFRRRSDGVHDGIDIRAPVGTPLYATQAGTVAELTTNGGYGNRIILEHSGGVFSHYAHLQSFAPGIAPTVQVTEGQLIGYAGRSGNVPNSQPASEDHVHFGISTSRRPASQSEDWKNPGKYLNEGVLSRDRG